MEQLVARRAHNPKVEGSSPSSATIKKLTNKKCAKLVWLLGQAVKTPPFHGGNRGSIPLGVTFYAGEGDRTLTAGLEGQNSTIELHPHI